MRRNRNKLKPFVSPTEEIDKINKLKITTEILERNNRELVKAIDEKEKKILLYAGACEKIEAEHLKKVEKLKKQEEFLKVISENLVLRESDLRNRILEYEEEKKDISESIEVLKIRKLRIDEEITDTAKRFNIRKTEKEEILKELTDKIYDVRVELDETMKKLETAKKEFEITVENTNRENKILSIKQRDIEIYEDRLRKKYPNDLIIL
jgi:chromosome segregation ATPase